MNSDDELKNLEEKVRKLEENTDFLKDLLLHLKKQFEQFKKDNNK